MNWPNFCVGTAVALLFLAPACSKDNTVDASKNVGAGIGSQCSGPGDPGCGTNGACVLGYCRMGCLTDAECAQGTLCIGDVAPYGCQLPQDIGCSDTKPCKAGLMCGLDKTCRMPCNANTKCTRNEQECIAGTCVSRGEPGAMGTWFSCQEGEKRCNGSEIQFCNTDAPGFAAHQVCAGATPLCDPATFACRAGLGCCAGGSACNPADGFGSICIGDGCQQAPVAGNFECWTDADCSKGTCIGKQPRACGASQQGSPGICLDTSVCGAGCQACLACIDGKVRSDCLADQQCLACLNTPGIDGCVCSAASKAMVAEACATADKCAGCPGLCQDCVEQVPALECVGGTGAVGGDPSACVTTPIVHKGTLRNGLDTDRFDEHGPSCTKLALQLDGGGVGMKACLQVACDSGGTQAQCSAGMTQGSAANECCMSPGTFSGNMDLPGCSNGMIVMTTLSNLEAGKSCQNYTVTITPAP